MLGSYKERKIIAEESSFFNDLNMRDEFIRLLIASYEIPVAYRPYFVVGIKKYANNQALTDEKIQEMVSRPQCISNFIHALNNENDLTKPQADRFAHWKGYFSEWIVCLEYNYLKNKKRGNILFTIVNPDTTSKADLLHLVKTDSDFTIVPGPDVKTGQIDYVLNSYCRNLRSKYDIPFIDAYGQLSNPKELTSGQMKKLNGAFEDFPRKRPISSHFSRTTYHSLMRDYLVYIDTEKMPSERGDKDKYSFPRTEKKRQELIEKASNYSSINKMSWEMFALDFSLHISEKCEEKSTDQEEKEIKSTHKTQNSTSKNKKLIEFIPLKVKSMLSKLKTIPSEINLYLDDKPLVRKFLEASGEATISYFVKIYEERVRENQQHHFADNDYLDEDESFNDTKIEEDPDADDVLEDVHFKRKSPQQHFRSGHLRTNKNGKTFPVSETMVNGKSKSK